jgi:hypothetical protein
LSAPPRHHGHPIPSMDARRIPTSAPRTTPSNGAVSDGSDNDTSASSSPQRTTSHTLSLLSTRPPITASHHHHHDQGPTRLGASIPLPHSSASDVFNDAHTHGLDLPWVVRDVTHSSSSANLRPPPTQRTTSPSPGGTSSDLEARVFELKLPVNPSRHVLSRRNQSKTACFVHSLLQNGRTRSLLRGSSEDLTRGSMLEVINKGPERRDRWNRGMTKKELSDMALGVRELSKRLGKSPMLPTLPQETILRYVLRFVGMMTEADE